MSVRLNLIFFAATVQSSDSMRKSHKTIDSFNGSIKCNEVCRIYKQLDKIQLEFNVIEALRSPAPEKN